MHLLVYYVPNLKYQLCKSKIRWGKYLENLIILILLLCFMLPQNKSLISHHFSPHHAHFDPGRTFVFVLKSCFKKKKREEQKL